MSVQNGFRFIQKIRGDDALRERVRAMQDAPEPEHGTLDGLVRIGAEAGFDFTAEELVRAHRADWAMRWAHFHRNESTQPFKGES